jgi:threonine dehydrogenase-like Zn-dependent dehydrogenase
LNWCVANGQSFEESPFNGQAIDLLWTGGKRIVIGIPQTDRVSFCPHTLRRTEISIEYVRRRRGCVPAALELIGQRHGDIDRHITHRFSFEESDKALDLVANYRDGLVKAMIEFGRVGYASYNRSHVELLHKTSCLAAFNAVKSEPEV